MIGRGAFGVVMYADLKRKQTIALSVKRGLADNDSGLDSEVYQIVRGDCLDPNPCGAESW